MYTHCTKVFNTNTWGNYGMNWILLFHQACLCHVGNVSFVNIIIIDSSLPGQNGRHFADDIFRCIFVNEKLCILIKISLKFVPKDLIDNYSTLVQVMAWCRRGNKPLPEPMLPSSLTHLWGTRGRWGKWKVSTFVIFVLYHHTFT